MKSIIRYLRLFGFDAKIFFLSLRGIPYYIKNYIRIKKQIKYSSNDFPLGKRFPCLGDRFENAGELPLHYFYQDLLVAQKIFKNIPVKHCDVGSRIDGFIAHVASFREIEVFDIRKSELKVPNIKFVQADISSDKFNLSNYCDSISSLHAIEHFGLGRYGDTIDINGFIKGLKNITKMLQTGGKFYFSVPIGKQRIEFDAHRIFSIEYLLDFLDNSFGIDSFSYIDDFNNPHYNIPLSTENTRTNFGSNYGCGIFELTKR
ncbi:MAG: DUF268 domain-containing protein [bacterium]